MVQTGLCGEFDPYIEARIDADHGFEEPVNNSLGYVGEQAFVANGTTESGDEQFVIAVNRPHVGEALHAYLQLMAPFRFNGANVDRKIAASIFDKLTTFNPGTVYATTTQPLHLQTEYLGIGRATTDFLKDVNSSWRESLQDDTLDNPFTEITAVLRDSKSYGDFVDDHDTLLVPAESLVPEGYEFPEAAYKTGLFAVSAWVKKVDGERNFLNHEDTKEAARKASLPIEGIADSYLGKLMIKYFSKPGEFEPNVDGSWALHMSLEHSGKKKRISIRELAPWIQLPMHQPSLVNSSFVNAAEALV